MFQIITLIIRRDIAEVEMYSSSSNWNSRCKFRVEITIAAPVAITISIRETKAMPNNLKLSKNSLARDIIIIQLKETRKILVLEAILKWMVYD